MLFKHSRNEQASEISLDDPTYQEFVKHYHDERMTLSQVQEKMNLTSEQLSIYHSAYLRIGSFICY